MAWRVCSKSLVTHQVESRKQRGIHTNHQIFLAYMGMDQYLLIPFLGGWTSIYQLFWCSPGVQGFDTLPHHLTSTFWKGQRARPASPRTITTVVRLGASFRIPWPCHMPWPSNASVLVAPGRICTTWNRRSRGLAARLKTLSDSYGLLVIDGYWWLLMVIDGYWWLLGIMNPYESET